MNANENREEIIAILRRGAGRIYTGLSTDMPSLGPADRTFARDVHPKREILFIIDGENQFMLDDRIYPAVPGAVFFLDSWEPHSFGYRENDSGLLHLWVHLNDGYNASANMLRVDDAGAQPRIDGNFVNLPGDIRTLLTRRWDLYLQTGDHGERMADDLLRTPINALLEEFAIRGFNLIAAENGDRHDITSFIKSYIANVNGRDCSLEHLEKICGYSRFHISHLFRRRTGMSIGSYINRVRGDFVEAAQLRGLKQKEIADELGFSSPATFWIWRRKHMGL